MRDVHAAMAEVVERWDARVDEDLTTNPLHDDEAALTARVPSESRPHFPYATTLLCATATECTLDLLQVGDGDVLVTVGRDGMARRPFPPPTSPDAPTDCLALRGVVGRCRFASYALSGSPIVAALLASDGFGKPFVDPDWHAAVASDLARNIMLHNAESFEQLVTAWPVAPADVGGDDTTLGILVNAEWFDGTGNQTRS
jgi:hypothetical protein